jgi:hypothetical protein
MLSRAAWLLLWLGGAVACQPNTTRPGFVPLPEAAGTEIRLPMREATQRLAEALRAAGIPVRMVQLRDGYLETGWFDSKSGRPTRRRPVGTGVVRVRAWADPARPGSSMVTIETTYRTRFDPSLPERELDRQVSKTHPVALKVETVLRKLVERFGGAPAAPTPAPEPNGRERRPPAAQTT